MKGCNLSKNTHQVLRGTFLYHVPASLSNSSAGAQVDTKSCTSRIMYISNQIWISNCTEYGAMPQFHLDVMKVTDQSRKKVGGAFLENALKMTVKGPHEGWSGIY